MEGLKDWRFGLRGKLALVSLLLLAIPWIGARYVNEVERVLLEGQEQSLLATARAVAIMLHDRPGMIEAAARDESEIAQLLLGVHRTSLRIWVVDRNYRVLSQAGGLRRTNEVMETAPWWQPAAGWLVNRPTEDFTEATPEEVLAGGRDIAAALQGTPAARTRPTVDDRAVVMSASHPIWNGEEVIGAVVAEETTNPVVSLKSAALERLLVFTLAAFAAAALLLIAFATRLSGRIRRLRDEAESAIDAQGRITRLASGSAARDEIGDLSRSFSAVLSRLAQHHAYLESMAGRLSHELRTPVAVVRSSLENLKLASGGGDAHRYIARAEEGLTRLNRILERMTEASRLEHSLHAAERERYDLNALVGGCVEGYRSAYPRNTFTLQAGKRALYVDGAPDLAAQLLDKLIENAADFSPPEEPIHIVLEESGGTVRLSVANRGPRLPQEMRGRLFQSMVSIRTRRDEATPHLGLGLYVARLIAEFHGGTISADDLPMGDGVQIVVRVPLAWK